MNQLPLLLRGAILCVAVVSSFCASVSFNTSTKAVSPNGLLLAYPTNSAGTLTGVTSLAGNEARAISALSGSGTNYIWDVSTQGSYKLTLAQPLTYIVMTNWSSDANAQFVSSLKIIGNGSRSIYFLNSDLSFSTSISTNSLANGETFFYATWTGDQKDLAQSPEPYLTGLTGNVQTQIDAKLSTSATNTVAQNTWVRVGTTNLGTFKSVTFWPGSNVEITTTNGTGNTNIDISISSTGGGVGSGTGFQVYLTPPGGGSAGWYDPPMVEEFFGTATAGAFSWTSSTANSGTVENGNNLTGSTGHWGQYGVGTATSTNAQAALRIGLTEGVFGVKPIRTRWVVKTPALSSNVDKYQIWVGFGDSASADPTDGAMFVYTHDLNGGIWTCKTWNNTSPTTASGGSDVTVVGSTWYYLDMIATSTSVDFYIASDSGTPGVPGSFTHAGSCASNIPSSAGREFGLTSVIVKQGGSTGTTNVKLLLDKCIVLF